ncbi:hypothetical protein PAPYR_11262 [Paratrimastix pyriformis]|uniref:Kringle domain-containing protein n=1 Tax=Paratrimastix pyriformis TaxID=342808 RepID=A0ABQ8U5Z7_9EUKA|nr:hypothetical protein PAPYR_11647 [Paratrimastix pyriformis]KAJ4454118.1 hypothetical protein PAPYR_11262 [Paratrimastix pyriformis]
MFGCGARGYTNTGKNWCYALEGLAPVHAPCDARCFMPALASTDAFLSVGSSDSTRHLWGRPRTHAGDTVECVPPLSCLMLVLALRHAHSQHQDGYP